MTILTPSTPPDSLSRRAAERVELLLLNLERQAGVLPTSVQEATRELRERLEGSAGDWSTRLEIAVEAWSLCFRNDLPDVLAIAGLPLVYNFREPYEQNYPGPWDRVPDSDGVTEGRRWDLMGLPIGYPIGIPASVLTANSNFIDYYARQGFNVLTYKTVRSRRWGAHQWPNWLYLEDARGPLDPGDVADAASFSGDPDTFLKDPGAFSMANSFGVPSEDPAVWQADIRNTLERLGSGKLLIVSIMGSSELDEFRDADRLADDFAHVAMLAVEAGAPAVELNLSCPNTIDRESGDMTPPICLDAGKTQRIVERVAAELRGTQTKLVAKLSYMALEPLKQTLHGFAGNIDAVSGINTIPVHVLGTSRAPAFPERGVGGLSGVAIRQFGRAFVGSVAALREDWSASFDIIGMGGVMGTDDVQALLDLGADAVQTATAAAHNPALAADMQSATDKFLTPEASAVIAALDRRPGSDILRLAATAQVSLSRARAALVELSDIGVIERSGSDEDDETFLLNHEKLRATLG